MGDPAVVKSTARAYRDDLRQLLGLLAGAGVSTLGEATPQALARAVAALPQRYAVETRRRRICALKSFFRYLAEQRGLAVNPAAHLRRPRRSEPLPRAYPWEAAEQMLASLPRRTLLDPRDRCLVACWFYAGVRLGETLALDWRDVDLADRVLHVRVANYGRRRNVTFGEALATAFDEVRGANGDDAPVFVGRFGSRHEANAITEPRGARICGRTTVGSIRYETLQCARRSAATRAGSA
ncbi:MAG TPA: site-specific integrase [Candidatus Limnocylindria bacterium]